MTAEALAALHAASFTLPRPWTAAEFRTLMAEPAVFLVTEPGGFALGRTVLDEAELLTIAVDPGSRRQGTGRALMDAWEDEARARGATRGFLEVAAGNEAARALYAACGFVEAGRRRGYYRGPDGTAMDALILTRPFLP